MRTSNHLELILCIASSTKGNNVDYLKKEGCYREVPTKQILTLRAVSQPSPILAANPGAIRLRGCPKCMSLQPTTIPPFSIAARSTGTCMAKMCLSCLTITQGALRFTVGSGNICECFVLSSYHGYINIDQCVFDFILCLLCVSSGPVPTQLFWIFQGSGLKLWALASNNMYEKMSLRPLHEWRISCFDSKKKRKKF